MGLLTVWTIAILLLPFLRAINRVGNIVGHREPATRSAYDLTIYKDQLNEVDRDYERGLFDKTQAKAARLEIQRRILALTEVEPATVQPVLKGRFTLMGLIAVLVPVGTFVMYGNLGSPSTPDFPFAKRPQQNQQAQQSVGGQTTQTLLDNLKARLVQQPNNIQGWLLLARSSMSLQKFDQAADAYRKAIALGEKNPDILIDYAEALAASSGAVVPDEARKIFTDTLLRNPLNARARYYLGLAAAQQGNYKEALQAWVDLRAISPVNAPWVKMLENQIAQAAKELGAESASIKPSAAILALKKGQNKDQKTDQKKNTAKRMEKPTSISPPQPASAPRGPTADDVEAAGQMSAEERAGFIRSMVQRLADRLKENPNDRNGWLRLARAYEVLGEKEKARDARAKAESLKK